MVVIMNQAEWFVLDHRPQRPTQGETSNTGELEDHIADDRSMGLSNSSGAAAASRGHDSMLSKWPTIGDQGAPIAAASAHRYSGNDADNIDSRIVGRSSYGTQNILRDSTTRNTPSVGQNNSAADHTGNNESDTIYPTCFRSRTLSASSHTLSDSSRRSRTLSASSDTLSASSRRSRTLSASSHTLSASSRTLTDAGFTDDRTSPPFQRGTHGSTSTTAKSVIQGSRTQALQDRAPVAKSDEIYVPRLRSDSEITCHPLDSRHYGKK